MFLIEHVNLTRLRLWCFMIISERLTLHVRIKNMTTRDCFPETDLLIDSMTEMAMYRYNNAAKAC
jgi:hypothetical protein